MSARRPTTKLWLRPWGWAAALALIAGGGAAQEPSSGPAWEPAEIAAPPASGAPLPPRGASPRHFEDATGDLPNEPVTAVAVDPGDDEILFAGIDGFLFKSDDGGESWRPVLSFPRGTAIDGPELGAPADGDDAGDATFDDVSFSGRRGALDDGGDDLGDDSGDEAADDDDLPDGSFDLGETPALRFDERDLAALEQGEEPLPDGDPTDNAFDIVAFSRASPGVRALAFVPSSPGVFYVATPRGLFRTTTGGAGFERLQIPGGARENDVRDVAVDPVRPSRLYVATAAGLMVTPDGGTTFRQVAGRAGHTAGLCVAAERTAEGVLVLAGTERGLFRSIDGGTDFLEVLLRGLSPFAGIAAVSISRDNGTYYAGTGQGLFVGERGASLLERYGGVPNVLVQAVSPDPFRLRAVAIGSRARGVLFSPDAGLTLDEGSEQVPAGEVLGFARGARPDDLLVATDRGVFRSRPGTGVRISAKALEKLRETWRREPSLDDLAQEALAWNRLEVGVMGGMSTRAAVARWLPQLSARYVGVTGRTSRRDDFIFRGGDQLPPGLDPDNDGQDLFGDVGAFLVQPPSDGLRHLALVELVWDLDKIVLSDDEVAALRQGPFWWAAERRVLDRVQSVWAARRRLMTEMALGDAPRGRHAVREQVERQLRIEELTAQLDAATGGAFSARAAGTPASTRSTSPDSQDVQEASR